MITFPNAKINIGLNIVEKRPDGFHNIETVFYPIGLSDILEINPSEIKLQFENTGFLVENKNLESNLCYKAYEILKKDFELKPFQIHLHKIIPFGAGIGGGSSDASFTLKMLNNLNNLNLTNKQLSNYAEKIGSDCSFFILNKPAFAFEKGIVLREIQVNLKGFFLVLVHPKIHINTAQAYSKIAPTKPDISLPDLIKMPVQEWENSIQNDFENSAFKDYPELKRIKEKLYSLGAVYSSMSGSGSAIYGIFNQEIDLSEQFGDYFIWTEYL
ncbi:MAG: 4-(cytidine 5'-diphospho)-2-C-methyl-D-erythritol kinase [Marinilabiliales bacterium]|nr:MAG: 4-(cytidine 5'-diphospho)-2-C-methyl-D-erythritol kinase [Marinilabiliales bacterium]